MKAILTFSFLLLLICPIYAQNEFKIWYKDCTNCAYDDQDNGKNYAYTASQKFKVEAINHNFDRRYPPSGTLWHRGWDINLGAQNSSEVPTEADTCPDIRRIVGIKANGMDVFETQKILLKKVEELTLYMINLDEQITELKKIER